MWPTSVTAGSHPPSLGVSRSIWLIANPVAGGGRARRALPAARRAFEGIGVRDVALTAAPGDEIRLVRRALDGGADTIAILGGDGTLSKATGAILAAGAGTTCRTAVLAGGTGNDFVASLGLPTKAWVTMARLAATGATTPVDTLLVDGRHALNVAGMGFDVAVLQSLERTPRAPLIPGVLRYRLAALQRLVTCRPVRCDPADGGGERDVLLVALANGRRYGGGLRIAPDARIADGLLDLVVIDECSPLRRAALFQRAGTGRHLGLPGVRVTRRARVTLRFPAPPVFQADGELHLARSRDVTAECVAGALRIVVPAERPATSRP